MMINIILLINQEIMIMELIDYKNKHSGETCFIIGSGPSIKNQDLS